MSLTHYGTNPQRPLSQAVRAGDFLFVSGQASTDPVTGELIPDTFEGEFHRSVDNLRRVLAEHEVDDGHIVKITAFVRDEDCLQPYNQLYAAAFDPPRPARTTIGLGLSLVRFEIEAIAYLGD